MDTEIQIEDVEKPQKEEAPVNITEDGHETIVEIGQKEEPVKTQPEDERWRRAEENNLRLQGQLQQLQSQIAQGSNIQQSSDPFSAEEESVSNQENALGLEWEAHKAAKTLTAQMHQEYVRKANALRQQRVNIAARRAIAENAQVIANMTQQQQFRSEFGDVYADQRATRYARGEYERLVAMGAPETPDTVRRAMNAARVNFKMPGSHSGPTQQDRQQMAGYSGSGGRKVSDNTVKMGKAEKVMAMAMYGDHFNGDENKVYAEWAKKIGIKAKKEAEKRRYGQR